ncbi:hypothetical protein DL89DRAFT_256280 [Linderina pennispora]|uniref:Uncharacterized protein n=1 Tax=Linderina pennispora TaxID=61395 RepID=A0A1Y1WCI1_9FUNG|nr:uncharacterized protein DL89DRAFT_256280 [Linderina pennispora]ORX71239.1 hypothetical protein DL89DRAFT_256280 [Linderina pennispora]
MVSRLAQCKGWRDRLGLGAGVTGFGGVSSTTCAPSTWRMEPAGRYSGRKARHLCRHYGMQKIRKRRRSGGSTALRDDVFVGFAGADDSSAHNAETLHDVRGGDADEQYAPAWAPRSRQQQQMTSENGVGADNQEGLESGEDGGRPLGGFASGFAKWAGN